VKLENYVFYDAASPLKSRLRRRLKIDADEPVGLSASID